MRRTLAVGHTAARPAAFGAAVAAVRAPGIRLIGDLRLGAVLIGGALPAATKLRLLRLGHLAVLSLAIATYRNRLPTCGYDQRVRSPWFAADFDSATALARALAASLQGRRFRRLGHGRLAGAATIASSLLPESLRARAFRIAGASEAIAPRRLADVAPDDFARWVTSLYPDEQVPAVAIGSADGAVMHLCAATGVPWLPQTFLVPVARRADPDDVAHERDFGRRAARALLAAQPSVQVHHMHDPNQDRLMVSRIGYFRLKMLRLRSRIGSSSTAGFAPAAWSSSSTTS